MTDTAPRNPTSTPQMLADALLRSVGGTSASLRVTGSSAAGNRFELGLMPTSFTAVIVSPVLMRKLRPSTKTGEPQQWEMLVSAASVQAQVDTLDLSSARSLFEMTLAVTVASEDYMIQSVTSNEAFGTVYLYRLTLSRAFQQPL